MTCTIAYLDRKNRKAYIASDSCASSAYDYSIVKNEKAFHAYRRHDILFGCAGTFRLANILKNYEFFDVKDKITCEFLTKKFIPELKEQIGNDIEEDWSLLIATKNNLFRIQSDFAVLELTASVEAIGNGGNMAVGAFVALNRFAKKHKIKIKTEDIFKQALEISMSYHNGIKPPFVVIHN